MALYFSQLGVFALTALSLSLAAAPARAVTLEEATRAAFAHEESVAIAESRARQADARVTRARSRFLPTISAQAAYTRQDLPPTADHSWYTRLNATQELFAGGRDAAGWNAARSDRDSAESEVAAARQALFATVARSFYAILSGEREVDNLRRTIGLSGDRVKEIRSRTKIGRSRDIEVLAAQAQFAVLDAQRLAAEGQLSTDRDEFALLTGLPRDLTLEDGAECPAPAPIAEYLNRVEARPDIVSFQARLESAESDVSAARAGHLPTLSLLGNYYFARGQTQRDNEWDLGASLSLPLFSGGETAGQVREASERAREAELRLAQARRQAETAIRNSYNHWTSYLAQIQALDSALASTQANYQEQAKNYRFGQATNLDVIQALNSFQDTKRTLDRTRFAARAAWAELQAATNAGPAAAPATGGAP